ncbi:hypothetical protein K492DRAFT_234744 [Lichtheimia hyalospora FSU 10163]|nr:hypothetical protein K492DRAFT_234744 [Lichtheimia hyalospora FSU 10163]
MSDQPPTIRLYYKPEVSWQQIAGQMQNDENRGVAILNVFDPDTVPVQDRGYECLAAPYVFALVRQNAHILAKVTAQGEVSDQLKNFIDNEVPELILEAQGY